MEATKIRVGRLYFVIGNGTVSEKFYHGDVKVLYIEDDTPTRFVCAICSGPDEGKTRVFYPVHFQMESNSPTL